MSPRHLNAEELLHYARSGLLPVTRDSLEALVEAINTFAARLRERDADYETLETLYTRLRQGLQDLNSTHDFR